MDPIRARSHTPRTQKHRARPPLIARQKCMTEILAVGATRSCDCNYRSGSMVTVNRFERS
jgi:hypothetical protein